MCRAHKCTFGHSKDELLRGEFRDSILTCKALLTRPARNAQEAELSPLCQQPGQQCGTGCSIPDATLGAAAKPGAGSQPAPQRAALQRWPWPWTSTPGGAGGGEQSEMTFILFSCPCRPSHLLIYVTMWAPISIIKNVIFPQPHANQWSENTPHTKINSRRLKT